MTYCIYHIPGKKIGVTNNIKSRVEEQQGYSEGEYEILEMSDNIEYISNRELELQSVYGYKVDRQLYKDLYINKQKENTMKINVTEATTTFPVPVEKLDATLRNSMGMQWNTEHGEFTITLHSIGWIMSNVKTSMYNKDRSYIYNKAFSKYWSADPMRNMIQGQTHTAEVEDRTSVLDRITKKHCNKPALDCNDCGDSLFDCIRAWAKDRGLYAKGDPKTQYIKLMEETGEIGRAILKNDTAEIIDGIGDAVVVLTNLAELVGVPIEDCIQEAYDVISKRQGKMVNGTFQKNTL